MAGQSCCLLLNTYYYILTTIMRKSKPKKRILLPDPKYKETLVTRFVNYMMYDGKKNLAYTIFYDACDLVEQRTKESGLEMWRKALNNVMPTVEVKSRRVGGATFQVPIEVRADRRISVGAKWMIQYARRRGFTGVDVRHNPNVAEVIEVFINGHYYNE